MRFRMPATLSTLALAGALVACSESEEPRNDAINPDVNTDATAAAQTEGANSFTEDQARGQAENAGFENVSEMTLTDSGLWQGTATRDGETVNVSVDYRGAVATTPESAPAPTAADDTGSPSGATVSDDPADVPGATSSEMRETGERG